MPFCPAGWAFAIASRVLLLIASTKPSPAVLSVSRRVWTSLPDRTCAWIERSLARSRTSEPPIWSTKVVPVKGLGTIDDPAWKIADRDASYLVRALTARAALWGNHGYEAAYPLTFTDAEGDRLDGRHRYTLRLDQDPPVDAFWSVTMYDLPDFYRQQVEQTISVDTLDDAQARVDLLRTEAHQCAIRKASGGTCDDTTAPATSGTTTPTTSPASPSPRNRPASRCSRAYRKSCAKRSKTTT